MTTIVPLVSRDRSSDVGEWQQALQAAMPEYRIRPLADLDIAQRDAAKVAIVADPDPADLRLLPNLIWVHSLWAGVERMVQELPQSDDLKIVRLEDPQMARTMAEAVLAWTLYLHRNMPRYRRQQDAGVWQPHPLPLPSERRVCILGLGNLGRAAAQALKANDFDVYGWNRSGGTIDGIETHSGEGGLEKALSGADIVVVLMPLTDQTRGMIGAEAFKNMRQGVSLINFARGPIIDDEALLDALDRGHVEHAVLDVFADEPLPEASRYWSHPSVTVLPHISAPTNRKTASRIVAENLRRFFLDGQVPRSVDRQRGY